MVKRNNEVFMVVVRLNVKIIPRKLAPYLGFRNEDEFPKKQRERFRWAF